MSSVASFVLRMTSFLSFQILFDLSRSGFSEVLNPAALAAWAYHTLGRVFWEMCSAFWAFEFKWLTDFFLKGGYFDFWSSW